MVFELVLSTSYKRLASCFERADMILRTQIVPVVVPVCCNHTLRTLRLLGATKLRHSSVFRRLLKTKSFNSVISNLAYITPFELIEVYF